jgi:hypothetical protein
MWSPLRAALPASWAGPANEQRPEPPGRDAKPGENDGPVTGDEADKPFWDIAAQIGEERQQWVIIWLALERRFRAFPKFRPRPG